MNSVRFIAFTIVGLTALALTGCNQDRQGDDWMRNEGSGTNHHTLSDHSGTGGAEINGDASGGMKSGAVTGSGTSGSSSGTSGVTQTPR